MNSFFKNFITFFFLILFIVTSGKSQKNDSILIKNYYKIGFTKFFNKQYFFGYERILSNNFSLNAQLGILGRVHYIETLSKQNSGGGITTNRTLRNDYFTKRTNVNWGGQLNLELKYYFLGLRNNIYIGFKSGFQYADFGKNLEVKLRDGLRGSCLHTKILEPNPRQATSFIGGTIGLGLFASKKLVFDSYLFVGRRQTKLINGERLPITNINFMWEDFINNHLNPVDKIAVEVGMYLGFGK